MESLVGDIPAGDGKNDNLFYSVARFKLPFSVDYIKISAQFPGCFSQHKHLFTKK